MKHQKLEISASGRRADRDQADTPNPGRTRPMTTRAQQMILDNRATAFAMLAEASRMEADLVVSKKEFGSGREAGTAEMICLAEKAAYFIQDRRSRARYLPGELLGEPAWDILLAGFERSARDRPLSLIAAWEASLAAPEEAKRWVKRLEDIGLVVTTDAVEPGTVPTVKLTPKGLETMFDLLSSLDNPRVPARKEGATVEAHQRFRAPSLEEFVIHQKDRRG